MIWLTITLSIARRIWLRVTQYPLIIVGIIVGIFVLWLLLKPHPKPDLKIYDPRKEINAIQRESDARLDNSFNAIDKQREIDDNRIRQTQVTPSPTKNINARDLEEKLRGNR